MTAKGSSISTSKLIEAIRQASIHRVVSALDAGCDIEEADQHGHRGLPLRTACFSGKPEIVRELIERGANVNASGSDGPGMPLRLALRARNKEIVKLLLASGAEIPPGVTLPVEYQAGHEEHEEPLPEFPPMEFKPAPKVSSREDFLPDEQSPAPSPEATDSGENHPLIEEVDITASYGLDTNLLNMDMLSFNEDADKAKQAAAGKTSPGTTEQKKGGFWKSGRHS